MLIARQSPVCQGLLIVEVLIWQSDTPHSVGLPWTSDRPVAETLPDKIQHSQETHPCPQYILHNIGKHIE